VMSWLGKIFPCLRAKSKVTSPRATEPRHSCDASDHACRLEELYYASSIRPEKMSTINWYVGRINQGRGEYDHVSRMTGVPWWVVAIIHGLESGFSWEKHLHNGDSLNARTKRVPKGRPVTGQPPFSWIDSAIDAMIYDKLNERKDWSLGSTLDLLEKFNGIGYRVRGINSPYLWSFTTAYGDGMNVGKYVSDGKFVAGALSNQAGAAAMMMGLGLFKKEKA